MVSNGSLITAIKDRLCNPCNKNLSFIKLKQVLNGKVHNLGKTASRLLFWQVLTYGDLLYASIFEISILVLQVHTYIFHGTTCSKVNSQISKKLNDYSIWKMSL